MEGKKNDEGKDPWELLPWDAVEQVVKVLKHGRKKYDARNWEKGMAWSRLHGAANRHLNPQWFQGREDFDEESGLYHLAHAACDILFLIAYQLRGIGLDDRPGTEEVPF
jgi:Domain of unknown function (DUF5664)